MKISREIKTALLVISGIILFIYGFSYLKGSSLLDRDKTIFTVYDEVEGLVPGAKVTINGLSVGKISKIDFLSNSTKILITILQHIIRTLLTIQPRNNDITHITTNHNNKLL